MSHTLVLCETAGQAAKRAADEIAAFIGQNAGSLVTMAAGHTPLASYALLAGDGHYGRVGLDSVRYIGLDEWVGLGAGDAGSCIETMTAHFYHPAGISPKNILYFDSAAKDDAKQVAQLGDAITQAGGLGLAVIGVGLNGHVGFNEPGVDLAGNYALADLSFTTLEAGKKYFGGRMPPARGATVTLRALMNAKQVILLITGAEKRDIAARVFAGEPLPAGRFLARDNALFIVDKEAYGA